METGNKIIKNTILLTISSLIMRSIGMSFQVYLTDKIGSAGVGLYGLIMSVYMLFTTFAISGIRFATTRLLSEELGVQPNGKVHKIVRTGLIYGLIFGTLATVIMLITAKPIGTMWIKDSRSVLSLKIISTSLPFLSMSAVLSGYFTAVGRAYKSAAIQFIEQIIRIIVVIIFYSYANTSDIESSCAAIMFGGALGDLASFTLQFFLYILDRRRYSEQRSSKKLTERIIQIAFPLALSAYCRTALSTFQQLLVPAGFQKAGYTSEKALSDYGIVHGMVLPVLTFPSALFYSFSEVIVPELTYAQVTSDKKKINNIVNRTLNMSIIISFGLLVIFFSYSYQLGNAFYGINDVGKYIRILSFLMPIMYLDSITDGLLRGLGQHLYNMWVNIGDSVISVIFVYTLLPKWAISAYIFIICFTEILNFVLSMFKLSRLVNIKIKFRTFITAVFSSIAAVNIAMLLLRTIGTPLQATALNVVAHIALSLVLYVILLIALNCIDKADKALIISTFTKK